MTGWLAILLALASLGGGKPSASFKKRCAKAAVSAQQKQRCKRATAEQTPKPRPVAPTAPGAPAPAATQAPAVTPAPAVTATPPPPAYPSRTGVDLTEWAVRPAYATLAGGRVVFNVANLGEDDHNLSVRGDGIEYGRVDGAPGNTGSLVLQLRPGTYTLYCSLQGHEEQGMSADVSVRG